MEDHFQKHLQKIKEDSENFEIELSQTTGESTEEILSLWDEQKLRTPTKKKITLYSATKKTLCLIYDSYLWPQWIYKIPLLIILLALNYKNKTKAMLLFAVICENELMLRTGVLISSFVWIFSTYKISIWKH